jgi:hypothetical protein
MLLYDEKLSAAFAQETWHVQLLLASRADGELPLQQWVTHLNMPAPESPAS